MRKGEFLRLEPGWHHPGYAPRVWEFGLNFETPQTTWVVVEARKRARSTLEWTQ
jgi:hypothetical protein